MNLFNLLFGEIYCLFLPFSFLYISLDTTRQAMAFMEVFPSIHIYICICTHGTFCSPPLASIHGAKKQHL